MKFKLVEHTFLWCMTAYSTALYWQQIGILPTTTQWICTKFHTSTLKTTSSVLNSVDHEVSINNHANTITFIFTYFLWSYIFRKSFPICRMYLYVIAVTKRYNPEDGKVCITSRYLIVFMQNHFCNTNLVSSSWPISLAWRLTSSCQFQSTKNVGKATLNWLIL